MIVFVLVVGGFILAGPYLESEDKDDSQSHQSGSAAASAKGTPAGNSEPEAEQFRTQVTASRDRALVRYPQFKDRSGEPWQTLTAYIEGELKRTERSSFFAQVNWPELITDEFVAKQERDRFAAATRARIHTPPTENAAVAVTKVDPADFAKAVSLSWQRVFDENPAIADVNSVYRKHFQNFLYELRHSGSHDTMFLQPDWPERALELRNQKYGPIPSEFR